MELTDLNMVVAKLTRGREIVDQLRDASSQYRNISASMLDKILNSFTESLSILGASGETLSNEISQAQPLVYSPVRKSEDSGESHRLPVVKDRRGCYKRRRTMDTWSKESTNLVEDGHAWRKYGQKAILHAKHPRSYYRCTHKYDQKCPATKQVQIIQDNPTRYKSTYHGRHTCKNLYQSHHQAIMDMATDDSSIIWSFGQQNNNHVIVKQEEMVVPNDQIANNESSLSDKSHENDYFVRTDELIPFGCSVQFISAYSSGVSDHGDVISSDVNSCTASTHSFDLDMSDFEGLPEL